PSVTFESVVRQIQRRHESRRDAAARLHHCVRVGWVKPIGKRHPGSGVNRRYPADTALRVVLLQAARDAGLKAKEARFVLQDPKYLAPFLAGAPTDQPLLVVSTCSDERIRTMPDVRMSSWTKLAEWTARDPKIFTHDTFRVIDVAKIVARFAE